MKGVVFTEFMELVESRMGLEMLDRIITDADLPNDGAYTAVGTYDHVELVRLVQALSHASGMSVSSLIHMFGEHLFERFAENYRLMFADTHNTFEFLNRVDDVIHVEVRKLYPDAELPSLVCECATSNELTVLYSSPRGFGDLAEGLIHGCIKHFGESISVSRINLPPNGSLHRVRFDLVKHRT